MPDHFGNPLLEQRILAEGRGYVARDDQQVISVSGADSKTWLHSLLSQDIANLKPGDSTEALLLTPQGHIEQQLKLVVREGDILIIVAAERAQALQDWLTKMRFRSQVEISATDLLVFGTFADVSGDVWVDRFAAENPKSARYRRTQLTGVTAS